ncbi:MAG: GNAT family N-acetyltransferase [Flavitalea sp.]
MSKIHLFILISLLTILQLFLLPDYNANMPLTIICKSFDRLSPQEIYDSLRMRQEVFVVEQDCHVPDIDNKDPRCHHLLIYRDDQLQGYARLLPAGLTFPELSIGRVLTSAASRGTGLGKILMLEAIKNCYIIFGKAPIRIAAQNYARLFYEKLGFIKDSDIYDLDGIDHILMLRLPEALSE